mmetsp:Transcript_13880/g.30325  ORF Transcript_13880/g.30325 Transcript_13880/m.30325 type:complete len:212 (-) Transcript_13880:265-900(-)
MARLVVRRREIRRGCANNLHQLLVGQVVMVQFFVIAIFVNHMVQFSIVRVERSLEPTLGKPFAQPRSQGVNLRLETTEFQRVVRVALRQQFLLFQIIPLKARHLLERNLDQPPVALVLPVPVFVGGRLFVQRRKIARQAHGGSCAVGRRRKYDTGRPVLVFNALARREFGHLAANGFEIGVAQLALPKGLKIVPPLSVGFHLVLILGVEPS